MLGRAVTPGLDRAVTPGLDTELDTELPGLEVAEGEVCEEQKGEAQSQQDPASPTVLWYH